MKGVRWAVLGVIIVASFFMYVLRTNINIVGEAMIRDLGRPWSFGLPQRFHAAVPDDCTRW